MNLDLLRKHIKEYIKKRGENQGSFKQDAQERREQAIYYTSWTPERMAAMNEEHFYEYISRLWAMRIWGNKRYVVDKLIQDNAFKNIVSALSDLVWGGPLLEQRWDDFRGKVKGMGPAMMSEILCYVHPEECMVWNRRAYLGLNYLGVENLPWHNYQMTGKRYKELSGVAKQIADEMSVQGEQGANLLLVDHFLWHELQFEEILSHIHKKLPVKTPPIPDPNKTDNETAKFIHDEIRDKLAAVGHWLGFTTRTEVKVAEGSQVDTVWEATIGNMGRVIYVFEVQTKGSIDSLIINLLKSMNNPAVQGVVAVSDTAQLNRIRNHAAGVPSLREKLKYWDYKEVLDVHESLESVNEVINGLGLVPQGF
jgi:hypothetical protein